MIIRLELKGVLSKSNLERTFPMFSLSRIQFSKFAAMGSLVVLSTLGTPTRADELAQIWDLSGLTRPFSPRLAVNAS